MRPRRFREPRVTRLAVLPATPVIGKPASCSAEGGAPMIPLLLWILGVPGLIIILLLLLGIIHL